MPRLKGRAYMTAEDLETAERNGKLDIASHIACPFCDSQRTTIKEDAPRRVITVLSHLRGFSRAGLADRRRCHRQTFGSSTVSET